MPSHPKLRELHRPKNPSDQRADSSALHHRIKKYAQAKFFSRKILTPYLAWS
jgi:hypothetical protein